MDNLASLEVGWVQGFSNPKVQFLDNKTACYCCGSFMIFVNMESKTQRLLQCPGQGIGPFAVSSVGRVLAFSELKLEPTIFVYKYPEFVLKTELKGTAKLGYTSVSLSEVGPYLACCSSIPDLTLTLWNWETSVPLCSKTLAGDEVSDLTFNPMSWHQMCTMSASSVTVWNVEKCGSLHIFRSSKIDFPSPNGSIIETKAVQTHGSDMKLTYYGPQMPVSAIAGLVGEEADSFVPKEHEKPLLCPSAICWTASSDLYVGCQEGHLLQVQPDTGSVSVLYDPRKAGEKECSLQEGSLCSLALHRGGLFAAGNDGVLWCLHVNSKEVEVEQCWRFEEPITNICLSPNCATLLMSSRSGCLYRYIATQPGKVDTVLDTLSGNFVAAAPLYTDKNFCVSVRDSGVLQLWSIDTGSCAGSLSLRTQVTSLACCPSAQYAAVGTASGHVLFVDLTETQNLHAVHRHRLYHVPVKHLTFDQGGNFLLSGAPDSHVFVLDARPSERFKVMGYTEVTGAVLGVSTYFSQHTKQVKALVLCSADSAHLKQGQQLVTFCLPLQILTAIESCTDLQGRLSDDLLQTWQYEVPSSLHLAVLGPKNRVYGYCDRSRTLQSFQLPESSECANTGEVIQLAPEQEVEGHPLGVASLCLSPHQNWLASVGKDGQLRIHETSSMNRYQQIQCHSCWLGGACTTFFTPDSQNLVTSGSQDGSLVCMRLRLNSGSGEAEATCKDAQTQPVTLEPLLAVENSFLNQMPVLELQCCTTFETAPPIGEVGREACFPEGGEQEGNNVALGLDPTADCTWLDHRLEEVIKEDRQRFSAEKESLREDMKKLRETVQAMMMENELLPDIEKLDVLDFNLDVEGQRRLQAEGDEEVAKVRNEIELENLARCYLREVIKRECWDSMVVKGQAIKAFHSDHEVTNYPTKERTEKELKEIQRVQCMRLIEQADCRMQQEILERNSKAPAEREEEEEGDGSQAEEGPALAGSLSSQFGGSNPYLYNQFDLHVREQKINQIILLHDIIYQVKTAFNKEFSNVYKKKEQEISRVKDKNRRIAEIMTEIGLEGELWEPALTDSERPERTLLVDDSEITVEKYLTPEQCEKEEELKQVEEQSRMAAKGDNIRTRALDDMMGGVLEVKKDNILKMEVPQPDFLSKPEVQWTEEEKKIFKEYDKKVKELSEEQEKYRKTLEIEMKKLQTSIKDATQAFDVVLMKLFDRKVNSEMVIGQEELKIANLVHSILIEEEIVNREKELNHKLQITKSLKKELEEEVKKCKMEVENFRDVYDNTVAEDKLLDRGFRKEFFNVPGHLVEQLYKLYKRRPRVQRMQTLVDSASPFRERPWSGRAASEGLAQLLKAMEELDSPEHMPAGLDPATWAHFCISRRSKVKSEHQVQQNALSLAEMQTVLQRRLDEEESATLEVKNIIDNLSGLNEEKMRFQQDIMVQFLLKQGQVEVEKGDFISDFSDSVLIHRSVVEDVNGTVKALGEQKIAIMVECKDIRKSIAQQEWELRRMAMQREDLINKAWDIQRLRVTHKLLENLNVKDHDSRIANEMSSLEKSMLLQEKAHEKKVKQMKVLIDQLNQQAARKAAKIAALESELSAVSLTVAERSHICEAAAVEDRQQKEADERYRKILQRKSLLHLVKAQAQEVDNLRAEVERLRRRTFPALSQPGNQ